MNNPFDYLTKVSVSHPKKTIGILIVGLIALSSFAMFIQFDTSQDSYLSDNETVRLLKEIRDEYGESIDFIRIIDEIAADDLLKASTWEKLAQLEAMLLENENLKQHQYHLYGINANLGLASSAIQWQKFQDPVRAKEWIDPLKSALSQISESEDVNVNRIIEDLSSISEKIPNVGVIDSNYLREWNPSDPNEWLLRMDSGDNISEELSSIMHKANSLMQSNGSKGSSFAPIFRSIYSKIAPLMIMQSVDYRGTILNCLPTDDSDDPWSSKGPVLITLVISTAPEDHGYLTIGEVQNDVTNWVADLELYAQNETGDDDVRVFSFSQLALGQNANVGSEISILSSVSLLLLGIILWVKFRSKRDTIYVLGLTGVAILATYGMAGLLTVMGFGISFNAAMNAIPILLLAIGVDFGLHVVARVREEMIGSESRDPQGRLSLKDFSFDARRLAIRSGAILTSAALFIAVLSDIVGFLSFRLSSIPFLVSFGTLIAVGLFFVYFLSITGLPALMLALPVKKLSLKKSGAIKENRLSRWMGSLADKPTLVIVAALILTAPMYFGFQQLEIGFDTRDNFDESIPVVADFLMITDKFQNSPSLLYVVIDGNIISREGRNVYDSAIAILSGNEKISDVTSGLWLTLEKARVLDTDLDSRLSDLNETYTDNWNSLENWSKTRSFRSI